MARIFSDAERAFILKQGNDGVPAAEFCRKAGISQATCYAREARLPNVGKGHNTGQACTAPLTVFTHLFSGLTSNPERIASEKSPRSWGLFRWPASLSGAAKRFQ
jgi:hypothetical protein